MEKWKSVTQLAEALNVTRTRLWRALLELEESGEFRRGVDFTQIETGGKPYMLKATPEVREKLAQKLKERAERHVAGEARTSGDGR